MIGDKDSVRLADYCFNICMALGTTLQGKDVDNLDGSVRATLDEVERCVDHMAVALSDDNIKHLQDSMRNRTNSQGGGEHATHQA